MKRLLFFVAILILNSSLKSQLSYQWAGKAGSPVSEYGQAIASDPSGNVYVTGSFSGTVDFDPGPGTSTLVGLSGSTDIFLAKYSSAGTFIWVKQIGSTSTEKAYDLVADATGPFLSGTFMGTCNFNIGGVTSTLTSLGGGTDGDGFFARYDVNGNLSWVDRIGSTGNDRAIGIAVDASQNVFVTGFIGANADMDPGPGTTIFTVSATYNAYFAKYTSAGALTFAKQIVGSYSEGDDLAIDASGNIYLTGSFSQSNDFDPAPGFTVNLSTSGPTQLDIFLAKYTSLGAFTFVKQIGGIGVDIGFQVKPDASGNIYLGGVFSATCDFNPAPGFTNSIVSAGQGDLFVGKYDVSGNYIWANGTGGTTNDYCYGMGLDGSNNVYITGNCNGANIDFDPGPGVSALTSTAASFYIASYNSAGVFSFVNSLGNIPSDGKGLIVNSSVYVTGMFSATGDFDFGVPSAALTSAGGSDVFFGKYNACFGAPPAQPAAISGTTSACAGSVKTYSVVNDPAATSYVWTMPGGWTGTSTTNIITATLGVTGTISVVATGTCGSSTAQTLAVTVNPLPVATASNNSPVCVNTSIIFSSSGGVSYLWTGPNAFTQAVQNPTIVNCSFPNAGQYTVIVTSAAGCTAVALTNVTVIALPSPLAGNNSPVCSGSTLMLTGSGGAGGTYNWFGPNSFTSAIQNPSITNVSLAATGVYTLVVSVGGCSNSATSTVTVNSTPTAVANNNSPVCTGQPINFTGSGGSTYTWTGPGGFNSNSQNPVISVAQPSNSGTYTLIAGNGTGCTNTKTTSVVVYTLPAATASNNGLVCVGSSINLTSSGGVAYSWNGPNAYTSASQNPTITNAQLSYSGAYTVMVTSAQGCTANAVTNVTVSPAPSPTITSNSPVCVGTVLNLSVSGGGTFNWSGPNSFTSNIQNPVISNVQLANAGNYTVVVTVGTCSTNTTAFVSIVSSPTLTAVANNTLICAGQSSTLTASGANTYTWTGAGTGASIVVTPTVTSTYTVTGTSTNNCSSSTVKSITVNPLPIINASTNNSLLCIGQSATLTATGAASYSWTGGGNAANEVVSPSVTTTYTVTGTGTNNCTGTTVITQSVSSCVGIVSSFTENPSLNIFPNPFSNEVSISLNNFKGKVKLSVINTLGQIIFEKEIDEATVIVNLSYLPKGIYFVRLCSDLYPEKMMKLVKE